MATRVTLAASLESRDGTVTKDAQVRNGIVESNGDQNSPVVKVRKRPGSVDLGLVQAGIAQLLYYWNGINTIQADKLSRGTIASIISAPVQTSLSPTNGSQMFWAQDTGSNAATAYLMFHNKTQAWSVTVGGTVASITLPSAIGTHTISIPSLTRVGTVATATLTLDPTFAVGTSVTISGATPSAYNGAQTVTGITLGSGRPATNIPITITRSGTTATATTVSGPHGLSSGSYTISGADQSQYNGAQTITVTGATTFTFTVSVTSFAAITGTWNPSDKDASVTLSGGNLAATSASGLNVSVRGTVGKSAGKWSWEVTPSAYANFGHIGASTTAESVNADPINNSGYVGHTATGWAYRSDAVKINNAVATAYGATFTVADVIGIALDMDGGTITFYKNGVPQTQAFSGLSGTVFPAVTVGAGTSVIETANLSGTFVYNYDAPAAVATGTIVVAAPSTLVPANFTFTIGGSPTTPATGTITGAYTTNLVPGVAYIDGYFNLMDENGVVYQSASDNPTSYPSLTFFTAQNETGAGKAVAKSLNWLIAFKEWSTEFFYDAKNPAPGSPFSPVDNGFTQIGCASGESVQQLDGSLFWLSQTRQRGRGVYVMQGLTQQEISTPDVARILNKDDLATVYAMGLKLDGHVLYLLTLVTSNITLVYDATSKMWGQWSSLTIGSTISVTSITLSGTTATVTATAHGLADGDPVNISGANQSNYNGVFLASYVSANVFTIQVAANTVTPATGTILMAPYTESYFKYTKYADCGGLDLVLHETNGHLYQILPTLRQDAGLPINTFTRTIRLDGGDSELKTMSQAVVIGDKVSDLLWMRWSDNDCGTYCAWRPVDLSLEQPKLRRSAQFRRRTIETKHIGNNPIRLEAIELEIIND